MGIKDCVVTPIAVDASRGQKAPSRQNRFSLSRQLFFAVVLLFGFAVPRRAALGQEKPGDAAEETTIVKQRAWLEGNFVRLRLLEDVSSASARVGDPVRFELVDGVNLSGNPIIAGGHVTEVQPKRRLGRARSLQITLDYLEVSGGDKIPLRGNTDVKGKNQRKESKERNDGRNHSCSCSSRIPVSGSGHGVRAWRRCGATCRNGNHRRGKRRCARGS
jgi:hypothetical protein